MKHCAMQVRIPSHLKKPLKLFAVNNDLTVPKAIERLITTSELIILNPPKKSK